MTKISRYVIDDKVTGSDKWIGSDAQTQYTTKNFTPTKLAVYFNENQVIDIGTPIRYKYDILEVGDTRLPGTITFEPQVGTPYSLSSISSFILSKYTLKGNDVTQYLNFLIGSNVLIYKADDINIFGLYKVVSLVENIDEPDFFDVVVSYTTGNGSIVEDKDYLVSLIDSGDIPTKTSDLINDGEDGVHPFITLEDVPVSELTSVGLTMPVAFNVANSPLTSDGTLAVTALGTASQYIRGDGQLATLPSGGGGGSSVNYYLNGSVPSGVAGYQQMDNEAIVGVGTDFTLTGNGLITQFLTDVGNPNRIEIPGGAWNFEMWFSMSSNGGTPKFYVELLKYNGTTFTTIANSSAVPETINGGTVIDLYLTSLAVPTTTLLSTDRLAIRVYIVNNSEGRTATLHTENSHLCEIITTFSGGVTSLNGLTANTQYLAVGTSGTNFNISSLGDTHTFNIPYAGLGILGGLLTNGTQTFAGNKTFDSGYIYLKNTDSINIGSIQSFSQGFTFKRDATNFQFAVTGGNLYLYSLINNSIVASIGTQPLTVSRTYQLPDKAGTFALVSDIGIYSLNGLITSSQTLATGTTGTDFAINSSGSTHTFNLPDAGTAARGVVSINDQSFSGLKNFTDNIIVNTIRVWRGSNNAATNIGIGLSTLIDNTGNQNTVLGYQAVSALLSSSSFTTAIGHQSLKNVLGNNNTAIGNLSGLILQGGSQNTFIGSEAGGIVGQLVNATNSTAIGYQAFTTKNNQVVLGNALVTETLLRGKVGIGTTTPTARLHVAAPGALSTDIALRVRNSANTGDLMTVDGTGILTVQNALNNNGITVLGYGRISARKYYGEGYPANFIALDGFSITYNGGYSNGGHIWKVNSVEVARITSTGNLLINTTTDIASSKLTIDSTTQGFLPPRMTNAQRIAIATPAVGLCVYCTDAVEGLYINKSTGWTFIG